MQKLPEYIVEGTKFLIDVHNHQMIQKENLSNTISFFDMNYTASDYNFYYDRETKNINQIFENDDCVMVTIPHLSTLHPDGMAEKYKMSVDEMKDKTDFEIMVNQELLTLRRAGFLPMIRIVEMDYLIDLKERKLRPGSGKGSVMDLEDMDYDCSEISFFYDATDNSMIKDRSSLFTVPEHSYLIVMPDERILDPYHMANGSSWEEKYLMRYPPAGNLVAKVIPAAETHLKEIVTENRTRFNMDIDQQSSSNNKLKR